MSAPRVSLIIPAWNEEAVLGSTLRRYLPVLESTCAEHEVLVVVDGAGDRTREIAESFQDRGVRVLSFTERLGKGGALRAGMNVTRHEIVGFVDADGPISAEDLGCLLAQMDRYDGAIGSRWVRGSRFAVRQPPFRVAIGRVWNFLVRILLGLNFADTQCGAKFFRANVLRPALAKVHVTNWAIDVAILFWVARSGGRLVEVPVTFTDRPESKVTIRTAAPVMLATLLALRLDGSRWRGRRLDRLLHRLFLLARTRWPLAAWAVPEAKTVCVTERSR